MKNLAQENLSSLPKWYEISAYVQQALSLLVEGPVLESLLKLVSLF